MKLYADLPARRTLQIVGDVLLVVWIVVWVKVAMVVRDATLLLATPGERIDASASGLADNLRAAGSAVGGLPAIGDEVGAPFEGAGIAADDLAGAGRDQVAAVGELAFWLGLAVALVPILVALAWYLPPRIAFARIASAGQRFVDASDDLDLLALRALTRQPLHVLAKVSDDPAGAWRSRDAAVIRSLAEIELRDTGLSPRAIRPA